MHRMTRLVGCLVLLLLPISATNGAERPNVLLILVDDLKPGDLVALHWGWVCERIGPEDVRHLAAETAHHLAIANTKRIGALT